MLNCVFGNFEIIFFFHFVYSFLLIVQVEQIAQLAFFAEGLLEYHKQCTDILKVLTETLHDK
jgi:hypothetical protein